MSSEASVMTQVKNPVEVLESRIRLVRAIILFLQHKVPKPIAKIEEVVKHCKSLYPEVNDSEIISECRTMGFQIYWYKDKLTGVFIANRGLGFPSTEDYRNLLK